MIVACTSGDTGVRLADALSRRRPVTVRPLPDAPDRTVTRPAAGSCPDVARPLPEQTDLDPVRLVLVLGALPWHDGYRRLAIDCERGGLPLLPVALGREELTIGPAYHPALGACWHCEADRDTDALTAHYRRHPDQVPAGHLPHHLTLAADCCLRLMDALIGPPGDWPASASRRRIIDLTANLLTDTAAPRDCPHRAMPAAVADPAGSPDPGNHARSDMPVGTGEPAARRPPRRAKAPTGRAEHLASPGTAGGPGER